MPNEPAHLLARRLRRGETSCVDVVVEHLARIDEVNDALNAVVARNDECALSAARDADSGLAAGDPVGPLHGVPITIKDSIDTADFVTTAGTEGFRNRVPERDASVVARLREAGAIVIAKTNTPEFTFGLGTRNTIHGRTNNPYDLTRSPSGSSGGSAAIVAAGGSALDIGSDIGGSIREPAHVCGLAGLKPTNGRIPLTGHWPPVSFGACGTMLTIGPLARSVADLELVLNAVAGPDGDDPNCSPVALRPSASVDPSALRVAWFLHTGAVRPAPHVAEAVRAAVGALGDAGAVTGEHFPVELDEAMDIYVQLMAANSPDAFRRLLDRAGTGVPGPDLAASIRSAPSVSAADLARAIEDSARIRAKLLRRTITDFDAIVCPVAPFSAQPHDSVENAKYELWSYEAPVNLLGWPSAVVRAGSSPDGMPVGVQVIAPPWREDIALRLASIVESSFGGFVAPTDLDH